MPYTSDGTTLRYTESVLIGKKKIGKDDKGKDIIDPMFIEYKERSRQVPAKVTDDELNALLIDILRSNIETMSIHQKLVLSALLELKAKRTGAEFKLDDLIPEFVPPVSDSDFDIVIGCYVYVYIDKVKSFAKIQTLSALLELKERRGTSI